MLAVAEQRLHSEAMVFRERDYRHLVSSHKQGLGLTLNFHTNLIDKVAQGRLDPRSLAGTPSPRVFAATMLNELSLSLQHRFECSQDIFKLATHQDIRYTFGLLEQANPSDIPDHLDDLSRYRQRMSAVGYQALRMAADGVVARQTHTRYMHGETLEQLDDELISPFASSALARIAIYGVFDRNEFQKARTRRTYVETASSDRMRDALNTILYYR